MAKIAHDATEVIRHWVEVFTSLTGVAPILVTSTRLLAFL